MTEEEIDTLHDAFQTLADKIEGSYHRAAREFDLPSGKGAYNATAGDGLWYSEPFSHMEIAEMVRDFGQKYVDGLKPRAALPKTDGSQLPPRRYTFAEIDAMRRNAITLHDDAWKEYTSRSTEEKHSALTLVEETLRTYLMYNIRAETELYLEENAEAME